MRLRTHACLTTFLIAVATAAPIGAQQRAGAPRVTVRAENSLPMERRDETIELSWSTLRQQLPTLRPDLVRVVDLSGREIVSQVVDEDGDGAPDDLVFQTSFWPNESKSFSVAAEAAQLKAVPRVFVYHDEPRDDIAWESDRVAFRIYGEGLKKTSSAMSSNGIDVWVKSVHALIVDKWYKKGHDAYHVDTGEGADFYDVGETLGNGGTGVWRNDTLYRGDNFKGWKIIANGPVRAVFELRYDPWNAGGQQVAETKRFVIDGGQNMYRQESVFRVTGGNTGEIPYVIGEVKRPGMVGTESKAQSWAWLTGWGPVAPKNGGHGEMGTALLLPTDRLIGWKETGDHYLAMTHAKSGEKVVHYIGAGWTASGDFPTPQSWWAYLDAFAQRLAAPIKVSVGSSTATR